VAPDAASVPRVPFGELHDLWFQVPGLRCNLSCAHCLVNSGPDNLTLGSLTTVAVEAALAVGMEKGAKAVYFTGGEPFLHRDLPAMLAAALRVAPTTVLTNGTLIDEAMADRLAALAAASRYSLEIRLSLDDVDAERNDAIRGPGVLGRVARAAVLLDQRGLIPILTAVDMSSAPVAAAAPSPAAAAPAAAAPTPAVAAPPLYWRCSDFLLGLGIARPRVKIMPLFTIGRLSGAGTGAVLTPELLPGFDLDLLQCRTARVVAASGVYACPILAGDPAARVAARLDEAFGPVSLGHPACYTCVVTGMSCANA
jgi:hypothetical protein